MFNMMLCIESYVKIMTLWLIVTVYDMTFTLVLGHYVVLVPLCPICLLFSIVFYLYFYLLW